MKVAVSFLCHCGCIVHIVNGIQQILFPYDLFAIGTFVSKHTRDVVVNEMLTLTANSLFRLIGLVTNVTRCPAMLAPMSGSMLFETSFAHVFVVGYQCVGNHAIIVFAVYELLALAAFGFE